MADEREDLMKVMKDKLADAKFRRKQITVMRDNSLNKIQALQENVRRETVKLNKHKRKLAVISAELEGYRSSIKNLRNGAANRPPQIADLPQNQADAQLNPDAIEDRPSNDARENQDVSDVSEFE